MSDVNGCVAAVQNYIINTDKLIEDFNNRYEIAVARNKIITDLNKINEKAFYTMRAVYQNKINEFRLRDEANFFNCGTIADSTKWTYVDSWRQNAGSNLVCIYKYSPTEIKRLMDVWDNQHKFVADTIPPLPNPPNISAVITCCNNGINLTLKDSNDAKAVLKQINQMCGQNVCVGDDCNNTPTPTPPTPDPTPDPDPQPETNTKSNENNKLILIIVICIIFLLVIGLSAYFIYKKK